MAPDGQGGIILFGGPTVGNDTWRYYQGQWTRVFPPTTPPPRRSHQMVFTGQSVLMFGGHWDDSGGPIYRNDTWEWSGNDWVQRTPAHSPSPRSSYGLAHDPVRNRTVLLGGAIGISPIPETWEWDGNDWHALAPAHTPTAVIGVPMAFAPDIGKVVAYGGFVPDGTGTNIVAAGGCYTWDGVDWSAVTLSAINPGVRVSPLAWSPVSHGLVMFAGHAAPTNDTWITGPWLGSMETFGTACTGPTGLPPLLAPIAGDTPRRDNTCSVRLSNLPTSITIPVFIVGFSDTWDAGGYPLPAALDPLGWIGCTQLVSNDINYLAVTATGTVDQALFVPPYTPLNFQFYVQALVLYLPTGVALSNGVAGVVGY